MNVGKNGEDQNKGSYEDNTAGPIVSKSHI